MSQGRTDLEIHKSNNHYRNVNIIEEQSEIAQAILTKKRREHLSSKELKDLGMTLNEKSDYKQAQEYFIAAIGKIEIGRKSQEEKFQDEENLILAECHYGLANCDREFDNLHTAIVLFEKAAEYAKEISADINDVDNIQYLIARNIGITYLKIKDYSNAACHFNNAIQLASRNKQTGRIPAVKSYYGLSLIFLDNRQLGFRELKEARELYPREERENSMDWAAHRYHMGQAYESINDNANALIEYSESLRIRKQLIDRNKIGDVYYYSRVGDSSAGLGRVCLSLKCYELAKASLNEALFCYNNLDMTVKAEEINKLLSEIPADQLDFKTQTSSNLFSKQQLQNFRDNSYKTPGIRN